MNRMLMCAGLVLTGVQLTHAATDDEDELLAQLAVAQNNYHQAIEVMHEVGLDIADLEQQLDALIRARASALTNRERSSIEDHMRRVRSRLSTLRAVFEDAEQDMNEALADIQTIYEALGALNKEPTVDTGG